MLFANEMYADIPEYHTVGKSFVINTKLGEVHSASVKFCLVTVMVGIET